MDHEDFVRYIWRNDLKPASAEQAGDTDWAALIAALHQGNLEAVLNSCFARVLLGFEQNEWTRARSDGLPASSFLPHLSRRLDILLQRSAEKLTRHFSICAFLVGYAALHAFLQAAVTGPPLAFSPEKLLLPPDVWSSSPALDELRAELVRSLIVDGVSPYPLIPHIELVCLARLIFNHPALDLNGVEWMRLRTSVVHQRLLVEEAPTLQGLIFKDLEKAFGRHWGSRQDRVRLLLERAQAYIYYGPGAKAREDLEEAARLSGFQFALTGRLGKRTKFQQKETSQLVVLAKSASDAEEEGRGASIGTESSGSQQNASEEQEELKQAPSNLQLNDDTLLESISFSKDGEATRTGSGNDDNLPEALQGLEPSHQPLLRPLDSLILLAYASSVSNTEPSHGLTREETLPYATRVLEGGSSNWQIYTHALLVRSRIEAYSSRTQERGLLQLQALVDQIIVETEANGVHSGSQEPGGSTQTFLPRASRTEAAPATERLRYIHQLGSPARWELEAELAARWVGVGGLKTALEIYERLNMFAEMALCHAGLNIERKARAILRKQLYASDAERDKDEDEDPDNFTKQERSPLPADAPRLFCILGDIEEDPSLYERAWEISNRRYARAQRALGKHFFARRDYARSAEAYSKSLELHRLDHACWFALGNAKLRLGRWDESAEAFRRAVQLDDQDADSWSNLAAALLRRTPVEKARRVPENGRISDLEVEGDGTVDEPEDPSRHRRDALKAFKRAAALRYDDWRIWENVLTVAASVHPPAATDIVVAMKRLIEIRGPSIGEKSVDEDLLDRLVRHVTSLDTPTTSSSDAQPASRAGIQRTTTELVLKDIVPLITTSRRLWQIVARVYIWQGKPGSALEASEKGWRALTSSSGWESGGEEQWDEVVDGTLELVDAYESLGAQDRTEGLAAGQAVPVAKDWRAKARNAVRGILGRGKECWEDTQGWERLKARLEELKGGA